MRERLLLASRKCAFESRFLDKDRANVHVTAHAFDIAGESGGPFKGYLVKVSRTDGATSTSASLEVYSASDILDIPIVQGTGVRERVQTQLFRRCFHIVAWTTYRHKGSGSVNQERVLLGVVERGETFSLLVGSAISHEELSFDSIDELRGLLSSRPIAQEIQFIEALNDLVAQFSRHLDT
ncbi:MAG: hypothetical protein M3R51_06010 [Candidatus Eremiobacteraeota bacterium]|nr:hypothetical protein [Candidatus Eremiobacteraeota bacterium]